MGLGLACLGGTSALLGIAVNLSWSKQNRARAQANAVVNDHALGVNPVYPAV